MKLNNKIGKSKALLLASILGLSFLGVIVYTSLSHSTNREINNYEIQKLFPNEKALPIYIIYSPTCPHCENLIETLRKEHVNVYLISLYDLSKIKLPKEISKEFQGTPMTFAKVNNTYIIINGYPTKEQENNGYYKSKEFEENYCKTIGGKPYYENNTYKFCWISNNTILGNRYAIQWLINQCEKGYCEKLNLTK